MSPIDGSWPSDIASKKGSMTVWKSKTGMVGSLVRCWVEFVVSTWLAAIALTLSAILSKSTSLHITTAIAQDWRTPAKCNYATNGIFCFRSN
jgi:hypothetical protein